MNVAIKDRRAVRVVLAAAILWSMVNYHCWAEDKRLQAVAYDAGFDEADCAYNAIALGSDGRIYFGMSTHRIDKNAHFCCYDPELQKVVFARDVAETLKDEEPQKYVSQGKIHVPLIEVDKKIYFATLHGYYKDDLQGREEYPGFHIMYYDIKTDKLVDLVRGPKSEGLITANLDTERLIMYGLTYPGGLLFDYDIKAGKLTSHGAVCGDPFSAANRQLTVKTMYITRALAINPQGEVYGSSLDGSIWQLDRKGIRILSGVNVSQGLTEPVDDLGRLNNTWRTILWDNQDKCFYGIHQGTQSLFKFDPSSMKVQPITRFSAQAFRKNGHAFLSKSCVILPQLGIAMGPQHTLYYIVHGPAVEIDGRDSYYTAARLVTYNIDSGRYRDYGPIFCQNDRRLTFAESILVHPNGDIYTVGWVEVTEQADYTRFKALRQIASSGETAGEVYQMMLVKIPREQLDIAEKLF